MNNEYYNDDTIKLIYDFKNIAVVGMSEKKEKSAHYVPKYLIDHGFNVIPINPNYEQIMGIKSFDKVSDVQSDIDIVNVFRKSEDIPDVVNDIIKKKNIKILWLQEGIHNSDAEEIAINNGIKVIYNRCIMKEHMRLF